MTKQKSLIRAESQNKTQVYETDFHGRTYTHIGISLPKFVYTS